MGKGERYLHSWFENIWNKGKRDLIASMITPRTKFHNVEGPNTVLKGPKEFGAFYDSFRGAFSNMKFKITSSVESGGTTAVRWEATMKHTGEWMGVKATGRKVKLSGMVFARVKGGKAVETWDEWDRLGLLEQIK